MTASIPVIAIVGQPNVGKSTLFNRLTGTQRALVIDEPGVTRDRQWGQGIWDDIPFIVIDTGGIIERPKEEIDMAMLKQSRQAIKEADVILFVVDGRQGLTAVDQSVARELRTEGKPVFLVVNKTDGIDPIVASGDFYKLGFSSMFMIAASHNRGIRDLMENVMDSFEFELEPETDEFDVAASVVEDKPRTPRIAIVGRPNVGKSTLVNRFLGEERVIVCDMPGTTRDSIYLPLTRMGKNYTIIDTAGVRKRKKVFEVVEKFSVVKTLQSIKEANVVLLIVDAKEGIADQELTLIDFIVEAGKGIIICANKWDGMTQEAKEEFKAQFYRLKFVHFAPIHFISALHGTGVGELFPIIDKVFASAMLTLTTTQLSDLLEKAIETHPPPLIKGRRIKLRFAHCGGHNPPTIVIHGNQTDDIPQSYQRYLASFYMKALKIQGSPVRILCKTGENPYAGKRNLLTPRQIQKRRRLMKFVKKAKG